MTRRNLVAAIAVVIVIAGALFVAFQNRTPDTVKVLVVMSPGDTGMDMIHAVELVLKQANGMAGSRKVELVEMNTDEASEIIEEIKKYENDPSFVAMIGATSSGVARQIIPVLNPLSISLITPAATWPGLTKAGFGPGEPGIYYPTGRRNFFRVLPSDDIQGKVAVGWLKESGLNTLYVIYNPNSPYSTGLAGIVAADAEEAHIDIAGSEPFDPVVNTAEELNALADKITATNVNAVFYPSSGPHSFDLAMALRARKPDLVIVGGDGLLGDPLPEDSTPLNGIYATTGIEPSQIDASASFVETFNQTYGKTPQFYVLTAYESMNVLMRAIETANQPTREGVLTAMSNIGQFDGAMGTWSFDANGDTSVTTFTMVQLGDGTWNLVHVFR